eukprot:8075684-Pyramimonas_sp.AAC.1
MAKKYVILVQETHGAAVILEAFVRSQPFAYKTHFSALRDGRGGGVATLIPSSELHEWKELHPSWHPVSTTTELVPGRVLMVKVSVVVRKPDSVTHLPAEADECRVG